MALMEQMDKTGPMVRMAQTELMGKMEPMDKTEPTAKMAPQVSQVRLVQPAAPMPETGQHLAATARDKWLYTITALTGL